MDSAAILESLMPGSSLPTTREYIGLGAALFAGYSAGTVVNMNTTGALVTLASASGSYMVTTSLYDFVTDYLPNKFQMKMLV